MATERTKEIQASVFRLLHHMELEGKDEKYISDYHEILAITVLMAYRVMVGDTIAKLFLRFIDKQMDKPLQTDLDVLQKQLRERFEKMGASNDNRH
jgi:hypothetical protein